jgi:zinc protease
MPATEDNLEFGLELEADRLVNSFIKREDLMSEFSVVRNEFERGENDATRVLFQKMLSTAYEWHNYGKSTIGNRTDIERVPIDNLQAFYRKYYRPDNAMLIVAGKFDPTKALELIAKHFGPIKNPDVPLPKTYTEEPPQDGERIVSLRRVGTVAAIGAVYHVPAASSPEFPAIEVLNQVLETEPTGRLYKALVEKKLASSVGGMTLNLHDPGALIAIAQTEPDKVDAARTALIDTLEGLKQHPITDEEVDRAKRQLLQARERTLANSQAFAVGLSDWAGCGDWRLFFLHRDRLEKVTAADVNKAAETYLVRPNRTVGVYLPTKTAERAEVAAAPAIAEQLKEYKGRAALSAGEAFDPTPANVEARVKRGKLGGVEYAVLPKKTRGETVVLDMVLRFGSAESLKGQVEVSEFVGPMLVRGTKTKTRQQIKDAFDKLNAVVNVNSHLGEVTVNVQTKKANLPAVLELLREVLREPTFPAEEFELLKREELEGYDKAKTEPQQLASVALRRRLSPYPADDVRYVATIEETIDRTKAVTVAQVKDLYEQQVGGVGQLAIVGDFEADSALKALASAVETWTPATPYKRIEKPAREAKPGKEVIETPDKANAVYVAGLPLPIDDKDPAYPALTVGNYTLGAAPLASRLSNRVRGKEGLSYGVGSSVAAGTLDPNGSFMIFAITNPKNIGKVDAAIGEEVTKFLTEGVSADELEGAKRAYLQAMQVRRGSDAALADMLAKSLYAGRTFQYYADIEAAIEKLQPGDVKAAFDKYVSPKKLAVIEAGDFSKK